MIRQVFNSVRFILEILLVILVVGLVYWWNPMNIFGGKPGIESTANIISEVREMGELITAEYYGEVVASIDEAQIDLLQEPEIRAQAALTYDEIRLELDNLRSFHDLSPNNRIELGIETGDLNKRKRRKLLLDQVGRKNILEKLYFLGEWDQTRQLLLYEEVLAYLFLQSQGEADSSVDQLNDRETRQILLAWYENPQNSWWNVDAFLTAYFGNRLAALSRREAKKKLAMIGRGTVKAGFNFKGMSESMYHFDEELSELHFFGFAPKILNADINPWFIPEKGIPGFDILTYNGKVDFNDSKKVKSYAVQKLTINARNAGIIKQAEIHGGETLSRLFTLLTGKEIKRVVFHHDEIIQLTQDISSDYYISYEEASHFENTIENELLLIDSLKNASEDRYNNRNLATNKWNTLLGMIRKMQEFEFESEELPYHYYSTFWYRISRDSIIDQSEWMALKKQAQDSFHKDSETSSIWALQDSLLLPSQFSAGALALYQKDLPIGEFLLDTLSIEAWKRKEKESAKIRNISYREDEVVYEEFWPQNSRRDSLLQLIFPIKYMPDTWESWITSESSIATFNNYDTVSTLPSNTPSFWIVDQNQPDTLFQFNMSFEEISYPEIILPDSLNSLQNVVIGDLIIFRSSQDFHQDLANPNQMHRLSDYQVDLLKTFLEQLYTQHYSYHNRDFLSRAKSWFAEKWESKSGITDEFPSP